MAHLRTYQSSDREPVIRLWRETFGYDQARNNPALLIDRKTSFEQDLFYVAETEGIVAGTIMAGYDGHRLCPHGRYFWEFPIKGPV